MKYHTQDKKAVQTVALATAVLLVVEFCLYSSFAEKWIVLLFVGASAAMLFFWDVKHMWNVSTLLLAAYVVYSGVGMFWAMSGKFFLREYSKLAVAMAFFLFVLLKPKFDREFVRRVLTVIAALSAIVAFLSVEGASTGLTAKLIHAVPSLEWSQVAFTNRLYGVFSNSNVEASLYALGMLSGFACMEEAEARKQRVLHMVLCTCSAFAFLLCISVGASFCFAIAVVVYLLAAGRQRTRALLRMFFVAIPTLIFAAGSIPFFRRSGLLEVVPLVLLVADAVVAAWLEDRFTARWSAALECRGKAAFITVVTVLVLSVVYMVAAVNLTSAYTFPADTVLSRSISATAGEHTLAVEAEGDIQVEIQSLDRRQILQGATSTLLYQGSVEDAVYTVPEQSKLCQFRFTAPEGSRLISVKEDGAKTVPLRYTILPDFVAERIQGTWSNRSFVVRQALWDYGMRLFWLSPVVGHGYGSFETGLSRVLEFSYETKYVHNHYIQVLLEGGVIGFVLYAGALLSMAGLLLKKRGFSADETYGWLYPALASVFVMMATVTCWDISMSREIYLCMVYVFFALIIRLLSAPLPVRTQKIAAMPRKKKGTVQNEQSGMVFHLVCALVPVLFLLTVIGNMVAQSLLHRQVDSYRKFFTNLETAVQLDRYEYNDEKLSYVFGVKDLMENGNVEAFEYLDTANAYAEELMQVQSNTIPRYLQQYYAATGQYDKMLEAAMHSTRYSASDNDTWNGTVNTLWTNFVTVPDGLLTHMELTPALKEYCDALQHRNDTALQPIELDETPQKMYTEMVDFCQLYETDQAAALAWVQRYVDARLEVEQAAAQQN